MTEDIGRLTRTKQDMLNEKIVQKNKMITYLTTHYKAEKWIQNVTSLQNIPKYVENIFTSIARYDLDMGKAI